MLRYHRSGDSTVTFSPSLTYLASPHFMFHSSIYSLLFTQSPLLSRLSLSHLLSLTLPCSYSSFYSLSLTFSPLLPPLYSLPFTLSTFLSPLLSSLYSLHFTLFTLLSSIYFSPFLSSAIIKPSSIRILVFQSF